MSVLLFRVDERLIHGQVVVGGARRLGPRCIIGVDDEIATLGLLTPVRADSEVHILPNVSGG